MNTITKWVGISAKFHQVHKHLIDGWCRAYIAADAPTHFNIAPTEPLGSVAPYDGVVADRVVTVATLCINETMRYGHGGVEARILTIGPDDRSRAVIDEWERKNRDKSAEDILWFPSLGTECKLVAAR